ncbi:MAG: serine/threonine protein kinase, partial [Planctomycetes bacterium]|nr:serine/threonine protein kinase [Planctomycetota bacterium]
MDDTSACPLCFTSNPLPAAVGPITCRACGESFLPGRVPRPPGGLRVRGTVSHDACAVEDDSRQMVLLADTVGSDAPARPGRAPSSADETIRLEAAQPPSRAVRITPLEVTAPALPGAVPAARPAGKFAVVEELNRGGMGVILRGRDRSLHREVAIKVIRDQQSPLQRARFIKEAQVTGQLEHPNIVPVHEFGVDESGRLFFAMKLVRGRTLGEILAWHRDDPSAAAAEFPLTRLVGILIQVSHAVAFAHTRGVVHRDLKPGNIMLGDFGEVMLMDWGLAKVGVAGAVGGQTLDEGAVSGNPSSASTAELVTADGDSSAQRRALRLDQTQDGAVIGTPAYMAPEQASGMVSQIDARSDVYALGAILYELLTLAPPVSGGDLDEVLRNASMNRIVAPQQRAPTRAIPKDLAAVAMKALAADPADRYPGAPAMRRDLERFIEGRAVSARSDSLLEVVGKFVRRHRIASMVAAVGVIALLAVGVAGFWLNLAARHRAEAQGEVAQRERQHAETARASA